MATQRMIYLVTTGEYSDYTVEAALVTRALADTMVAMFPARECPAVEEFPVLDYVPTKVPAFTYTLVLDSQRGWRIADSTFREMVWDFQAPKGAPRVKTAGPVGPPSGPTRAVQYIRITHRDESVARETAEAMLVRLRAEASGDGRG